jgi:hypothetical protein
MAAVKYPGRKIQRTFGFYSTLGELFAVIAATPSPRA